MAGQPFHRSPPIVLPQERPVQKDVVPVPQSLLCNFEHRIVDKPRSRWVYLGLPIIMRSASVWMCTAPGSAAATNPAAVVFPVPGTPQKMRSVLDIRHRRGTCKGDDYYYSLADSTKSGLLRPSSSRGYGDSRPSF